ncbi:MAG: outer membrane lipoprotein-sorting protein [Acidobacteria bacterium]|nr:outer membrane lipoprotein-sorting protein [Acidobacteriota bacterium]MCA1640600.1 outer membrane lipoprotein-sorting protein [Acidobacteriota bacterium]
MFRKSFFAFAFVALAAVSATAQTADEIIAKHVTAMGGMAKLNAVKSMRLTGKMTVGPGIEAPAIIEFKRPKNVRLEITLQGMTAVQAYDGANAWQIMPFQGNKNPEAMGEDERKNMEEEADFVEGPLVNYKAKGHKVELIGKDKVEGSDAYKLKITLKNGDVQTVYLDADTFLAVKAEGKRMVRGSEVETESFSGDYKEVEGLMIPHSLEAGQKGSPQRQRITIEKVEINPAVEDARFKMPEVKKAEGNAPAAKPENKESETKPAGKKPEPGKKPPVG